MGFFGSEAQLGGVRLGGEEYGTVPVGGAEWGNVNLTVVDWTQVNKLGDECETQWKLPVEYQRAVRANRQLAAALRAQGLNDAADHYTYRAHVNQQLLRPQQALLPIVLRVVVRECMPLPKVLLRLQERRQGEHTPRHPVALALVRLLPLLLVLLLIKPLVLVLLFLVGIASFLSVLSVMRKRRLNEPQYRRALSHLPPPGLFTKNQWRRKHMI